MNHLNQIILEGIVEKDAKVDGVKTTLFIKTKHYSRVTDDLCIEEVSHFEVVSYGSLAEFVGMIEKNRTVRIVGVLKQDGNGVYILAEHIELKPKKEGV